MACDPEGVARRFAANLREARRRADLSQEDLSFAAELHRTEVSMLERGIRLPRIDTLIKLAGALEVSPAELLDGLAWSPGAQRLGEFRTVTADEESDSPQFGGA